MRVRTYGFPGCFTRPPGTSTRHHPHEPTTSKPVVPEDACCNVILDPAGEKKRRGPGPLEEPTPSGPRTFLRGWRGLTPQWPRSLRLGSASGFKVARPRPPCKPLSPSIPHFPGKSPSQSVASDQLARGSTWRGGPTRLDLLPLTAQTSAEIGIPIVRRRLSLLPQ